MFNNKTILAHFFCTIALWLASACTLFSQHPKHFKYDDQNGLPSNEVYSITLDRNGFLWIGSDAGLHKFNGLKYIISRTNDQTSKSITGLTYSSSHKLYCYNFKSQLFCYSDQKLKEIPNNFYKITNIQCDKIGQLFVCHSKGISVYNETTGKWKHYATNLENENLTHSVQIDEQNNAYFISNNGIGKISSSKLSFTPSNLFEQPTQFILALRNENRIILTKNTHQLFIESKGVIKEVKHTPINEHLANKTIIDAKFLTDGNLWISTFSGIVKVNLDKNTAQTYFPEYSFSNCLMDREGSYWFSTIQAGLLRIPNLELLNWNTKNELNNGGFTRLDRNNEKLFFATGDGQIGEINTFSGILSTYPFENKKNLQSLDFDPTEQTLWMYAENCLFQYAHGILINNGFTAPVKARLKVDDDIIWATSYGTYVNGEVIFNEWSRQLYFEPVDKCLWIATNSGLLKTTKIDNKWAIKKNYFQHQQILAIDFDVSNHQLYALSFDGKIYQISTKEKPKLIKSLPSDLLAYKLKFYKGELFIATNKGVWIVNLKNNILQSLTANKQLVSDNVRDLAVFNNNLWIATAKGLQKIPIKNIPTGLTKAKVFIKNIETLDKAITLNYSDPLILVPETNHYASNGMFEYAYRIPKIHEDWIKLPGTIEIIELPNIPIGLNTIELKVIDIFGNDSENTISLTLNVQPPFWRTYWFYTLMILFVVLALYLIMKSIISSIRKKELVKTELINSQLKAIRAQMNPHFMYNTLNSIQDLILQNDIKNTNYYLSKFSQLMRQILSFSEEEKILLVEEIDMLQNYLDLEKLRFGDTFTFSIHYENDVDIHRNYIPSLILQPFVENAIKHGLLHKKGAKKLTIRFASENDYLKITIEDNGIGREHSKEINLRRNHQHKSFASNAVKKRVQLLNDSGNHEIHIEISDPYPNNKETGTVVNLTIKKLNGS